MNDSFSVTMEEALLSRNSRSDALPRIPPGSRDVWGLRRASSGFEEGAGLEAPSTGAETPGLGHLPGTFLHPQAEKLRQDLEREQGIEAFVGGSALSG